MVLEIHLIHPMSKGKEQPVKYVMNIEVLAEPLHRWPAVQVFLLKLPA
jgi:hypothetical protein